MWILILLLLSITVRAADVYYSELTVSNIVYTSTNATQGDVYHFPAGSINLTTTINITNNISLIFSNSVITNDLANHTSYGFYIANAVSNLPIRISGLTIYGGLPGGGIRVSGSTTKPIKNVRIDHCNFENCDHRAIFFVGYENYGLVDHCNFTNNSVHFEHDGDMGASWNDALDLGTTNSVVIEDCYFEWNTSYSAPRDIAVYTGQGSRTYFRHNTFKSTEVTANPQAIDAHGNTDYLTNSNTRGSIWNIYEYNNINYSRSYNLFYLRGGTTLMYSNTLAATTTGSCNPVVLTEEEGWSVGLFGTLRTEWPADDQITNTFFWGNTHAGTNIVPVNGYASDSIFIQQNRDYWLESPNATNGSPVGVYNGYTPVTYPHPLSSGIIYPPTLTITAPTNNSKNITGPVVFIATISGGTGNTTNLIWYTNGVAAFTNEASPWTFTNDLTSGQWTNYAYVETDDSTNVWSETNVFTVAIQPSGWIDAVANFVTGAKTLTINTTASPDASLTNVIWYANSAPIGSNAVAPYSITNTFSIGYYSVYATLWDTNFSFATTNISFYSIAAPSGAGVPQRLRIKSQ